MNMKCETVKIRAGDGYMIINESDYDPKKHTLFDKPATKTATKKSRKKKGD